MVILVNRTAYRTKAVMAVRQYIRHRELGQSAGSCRLDYPHKGNVMGSQLVKLDFQLVHGAGRIMRLQNPVRKRCLLCLFCRHNTAIRCRKLLYCLCGILDYL